MHAGRDGVPLLLSQFPASDIAVIAPLTKAPAGQPALVQSLVAQIKL